MSDREATYEINPQVCPKGTRCICKHPMEAHGSDGKICAVCPCRVFVEKVDPKRPVESRIS